MGDATLQRGPYPRTPWTLWTRQIFRFNQKIRSILDNLFLPRDVSEVDENGDLPDDLDHGYGSIDDIDENGDIEPGPGKGGVFLSAKNPKLGEKD